MHNTVSETLSEMKMSTPLDEGSGFEDPSLLVVYPNPAKENEPVYLVAQLPEGVQQATIRLVDPLGRLLKEERITSRTGIVEFNTDRQTSGLYAAGLFADGVQLESIKFEVIH